MSEDDKFRFMHIMVRVKDLDRSLDFYTGLLGMTLSWVTAPKTATPSWS